MEEELILEDGKFYPMMKVVHGEKEHISEGTPYTLEEWFGGLLLKRRHPVLKEYLERELRIRNDIVEKLKKCTGCQESGLGEIEEERQVILTALKESMKAYELTSWLEKKYPAACSRGLGQCRASHRR